MIDLHFLITAPALLISLSLCVAFRRYAWVYRGNATRHLGAAMFWLNFAIVGRSLWWDLAHGFGLGIASNAIWAAIVAYGSLHALKALHLLLPPEDQQAWNLFTVAFYPYRLWRRLEENDKT